MTTPRALAPEADLAHVLDLAKTALRTGTMIDPEALLCDLLGLDELQLYEHLDTEVHGPVPAAHEHRLGAHCQACGPCTDDCTPSHHAQPADQSRPALTRAREPRSLWRQAEAGTVQHLVLAGRALCAADDAGPWRTVAGVAKCAGCLELEEVLGRHG